MRAALPIDLVAALEQRTVESDRLEYKSGWNHETGSAALATIAAFANDLANLNGGYLVVGVREERGLPVLPAEGIPEDQLDAVQKAIHGAIRRIEPAYHPTVHPVRVGERTVLVVHCPAGDARPYEAPESLARGASKRRYVRVGSETKEAKGSLERQLLEVSRRVPFDDRACLDARVDDLSPDLFWHHLESAQSRLSERRGDARAAFRQWRLLAGTNGHEVPRNVAVLFFTEEPRRWIPGAHIEVAQLPEGRAGSTIVERRFEGPLPAMLRNTLEALRGLLPLKVVKHADRAEADRIEAWPFAAVEEAVVNAIHHRGYDTLDPVKVEILPDALRVISYPGPMPGVTVEALATGELSAVPSRNRRIAELLKEVRLAEARGTGVARIREALAANGSPPPQFRFDPDRTFFEVVLPIHPAFRPVAPRGQPLRVGRPAPADEVVGRDDVVSTVRRALEHGHVALVGPDGMGTSSVVGVVSQTLDGRVFRLDLHGLTVGGIRVALADWRLGLDEAPRSVKLLEALAAGTVDIDEATLGVVFDAPTTVVLDSVGEGLRDFEYARVLDLLGLLLRVGPHLHVLVAATTPPRLDQTPDPLLALRPVVLPPLGEAEARLLADRLVVGARLEVGQDVVDALARLSAGIPRLLHLLVREVYVRGARSIDAVELACDELLAEPGDPTGVTGLARSLLDWRESYGGKVAATATELLSLLDAAPEGLPRLDLVARAASRGLHRSDILTELRELELRGWVADVDGRVRFVHPRVRAEWSRPGP